MPTTATTTATNTIGLTDLDITDLIEAFTPATQAGRDALTHRLENPLSDAPTIITRQNELKEIRKRCKNKTTETQIATLRKRLADSEEAVHTVANASSDKRHAEYYSQILWDADSPFAFLNTLDWFNEIVVFIRTILLPAVSILLPVLVLIAPLMLLLCSGTDTTLSSYLDILNTSLKKAMPSVLGKPRFAGTGGILEMGEKFVHIGVSFAMFVVSIWNQVSGSLALCAVVDDMRTRANAVRDFASATRELEATLFDIQRPSYSMFTEKNKQLGIFGEAWNKPASITALLERAGHLDMLASLALAKRICFPMNSPLSIELKDLYHPGISESARVYNSITMNCGKDKQTQTQTQTQTQSPLSGQHVMLTGPNRGGKSTILRAVGTAVLMSQTVGIVFARSAMLPIFTNIVSALSPADKIDKLSLFESEIEFAKNVRNLRGTTFLIMDEIFHGTNAHDGVEASKVFLDDLYTFAKTETETETKTKTETETETEQSVFSIISTHYMELPERYKNTPTVQNLCMDAEMDKTNQIKYHYTLKKGMNALSSVREILQERGLIEEKQNRTTVSE